MKPKQCDRVIIRNIPIDYAYRDLYGLIKDSNDGIGVVTKISPHIHYGEIVSFMCLYTPYKDKDKIEIGGVSHSIQLSKIKFLKTDIADFWRFKNGEIKVHNGETYYETVNWWECEFSHLFR
jgi:hypothetical protein